MTVSPDEKHSALLLRLSRTRRTDPILEHDTVGAVVAGIHDPPLGRDLVILALDEEALCEIIPRYRDRRAVAAMDATASVESFRVTMYLIMRYLFGIRCCAACPDCVCGGRDAEVGQDVFGSSAESEGGVCLAG